MTSARNCLLRCGRDEHFPLPVSSVHGRPVPEFRSDTWLILSSITSIIIVEQTSENYRILALFSWVFTGQVRFRAFRTGSNFALRQIKIGRRDGRPKTSGHNRV